MPQLEQGQLKALPAAPGGATADAAPPSGSNAHLMNSHAEVKQSLEKFTDSLHQKAVQVTSWLAAVDKGSNARAAALLAHNFLKRNSATVFVSFFHFEHFIWGCHFCEGDLFSGFLP